MVTHNNDISCYLISSIISLYFGNLSEKKSMVPDGTNICSAIRKSSPNVSCSESKIFDVKSFNEAGNVIESKHNPKARSLILVIPSGITIDVIFDCEN